MACNCNNSSSNISYTYTGVPCPNCSCTCTSASQTCGYCSSSCTPCGEDTTDSSKIIYSGPALTCLDLPTDSTIEEIVQAIDGTMCEITGADYSTYNTDCLENEDESQITTQQEFVESISSYVCNFMATYNTFVTNYNTFVTNITNLVTASNVPGIVGDCTGIIITDTNAQAFVKVDAAMCVIQEAINPSGADWESCGFTVGTAPETITEGFDKILDYMCIVKDTIPASVTLPTFDNVGTCLPGTLTTTDTLVSTVGKIKTKLCELDYDLGALNFGCVNGATALADVIQNMLNRMNEFSIYEFDEDYFEVTNINDLFPCNGKHVTINAAGLDYKVASNGADVTPGTLEDKLEEGAGITLDYITTPGKVIIASDSVGDHKVIVNGSDVAPDYLDAKIDGDTDTDGFLTLDASSNVGNDTVIITPTFDWEAGAMKMLTTIQSDTALYSFLKTIICSIECGDNSTVQFVIETAGATFQFTADQNTPTLAMYDTGATTVVGTITSGTYALTTVAANPEMTLVFQNNGAVSYDIDIDVRDLSNVVVPSSSSVTTTVVAGAPYTDATFNLGIGTTAYVVHLTITT